MAMTLTDDGHVSHTPGPWWREMEQEVEEIYATIDERDYLIADASGDHRVSYDEAEANANLIAAAPELLDALKGFLEHGPTDKTQSDARAAIAKAEGKQGGNMESKERKTPIDRAVIVNGKVTLIGLWDRLRAIERAVEKMASIGMGNDEVEKLLDETVSHFEQVLERNTPPF
jgi:hypothetical protein